MYAVEGLLGVIAALLLWCNLRRVAAVIEFLRIFWNDPINWVFIF